MLKIGPGIKRTKPPNVEDATLDVIAELKDSLENCLVTSAGTIGVILAAAISSTFLAIARVSTLQ